MIKKTEEIFNNINIKDSIFIEQRFNVDEYDINCRVPKEIFKLSHKIFDQYDFCQEYTKHKEKFEKLYRKLNIIFIINLFNAYFYEKNIACPKGKQYYINNIIPYVANVKFFTIVMIKNHIKRLIKHDLINITSGYYDHTKSKKSFVTRITPKQKLIDEFNNCNINHSIDPEYVLYFSDHLIKVFKTHTKDIYGNKIKGSLIQDIRDGVCKLNDRHCEKKVTNLLKELKPKIQYYNDEVQKRSFKLDYDNQIEERLPYLINKNLIDINYMNGSTISPNVFKIKIIYNNSSLIQGGRAYNLFQLFSKILRKKTKIDNHNVNIVDLSGCHIRMLYHINNMDIEREDLYNVYYDNDPKYNKVLREITKVAILITINAKSMSANILTLKNKIIEEFQREYNVSEYEIESEGLLNHDFIKKWFYDVMNQFEEVKDYFFTGIGLSLQNIESKIIFNTIYELLKDYDILSLPIHDEIVVRFDKSELTKNIILKNYNSFKILNGYLPKIKIT